MICGSGTHTTTTAATKALSCSAAAGITEARLRNVCTTHFVDRTWLALNILASAAGNHSDLTVASSQYDILLCSETLVSDMRHVSEILHGSLIRSPCLVVPAGQDASGLGDGCIRTRWLRRIPPTKI